MEKYYIKQGDSFYKIAQTRGGNWQEYLDANPHLDPTDLKVGQIVNIPQHSNPGYAASTSRNDDVLLEVDGVRIKVTREGEPSIPHELHLVIPRTEIRKIECPYDGTVETRIMLSNINIVNSPRIRSEGGSPTSQIEELSQETTDQSEAGDFSYE